MMILFSQKTYHKEANHLLKSAVWLLSTEEMAQRRHPEFSVAAFYSFSKVHNCLQLGI